MDDSRPKGIRITEREHELPYSKGQTASSLMITGLPPPRAYAVANQVERDLLDSGRDSVSEQELWDLTLAVLRREAGDKYAEAFTKWQAVAKLELPLIILIGGATGVGKSTVATQLAGRLGITRVISTDAVREVLRSALTADMFPTLYASSFEADKAVRQPIPHSGDRLIIGFREQAAAVAVGARALIDRALQEGTDMIMEGAHLVPGFLEGVDGSRGVIVPLLVTIPDEELHRSHFYWRTREANRRPGDRYLNNFKKIRKLQKYMESSAAMRGVPMIEHVDVDQTLSEIVDHVISRAAEALDREENVAQDSELLERAAQAVGKEVKEGSTERETVS
ncbi:MAG: 2-phosphoglycerate kinase [Actinomycetota bacterium]|nr:2-phosphoglycerate kinase [Actinomycetota bacterium]